MQGDIPAKQTLEFIKEQTAFNKRTCENDLKVHLALFGDGNGNKGMVAKFDDIYKVVVMTQGATKFFISFIAFVATIIGGVYTLMSIFKNK